MTAQLKNILVVDIETVPTVAHYHELSEAMKLQWDKKAERLYRDEHFPPEESFIRNGGIYAEFGKIICISVGRFIEENGITKFRIRSFAGDEEKKLLQNFSAMLQKNNDFKFICGHNIREFDVPYICRRMLISGLPLPSLINISGRKPYELDYLLDTLHLWKFGDYKHFTSLPLLTELFQIPTPKDDIDGSMVAGVYWKDNDLQRIVNYCQKDVAAVAQLYLKMNNHDLIEDENIEMIE